jgi:NTE family protein
MQILNLNYRRLTFRTLSNQRSYLLFFASFLLSFSFAFGQQKLDGNRPKLGLVLSGGGAKGFAHVGAIKVFEEAGLHFDYIGGTSMGSIIGGLYAMGYHPDTMSRIIRGQDWTMLLNDKIPRKYIPIEEKQNADRFIVSLPIRGTKVQLKQGLYDGQVINILLAETTSPVYNTIDFNELETPFVCIGTDLVTGENVVLNKGSLAKALRASMSIPSYFTPVDIDGRLLVDGGIVNNFPVLEVKDMGADIIIGVDIQSGLYEREEITTMVKVLDQVTSFYRIDANTKAVGETDIYIKPELAGYDMMSFTSFDSIYKAGEVAARAIFPQLKRLADSLNSFGPAKYKIKDTRPPDSIFITVVQYKGLKKVAKNFLDGSLKVKPRTWVKMADLKEGVLRAYGSGFFESIDYSFLPDEEGANLVIEVKEGGQGIMGAGIHYDSDYKVALLLNATFKNFLIKGSKLFVDVGLGENPKASAYYLVDRAEKPGFGIRYTYFNLDFKSFSDGVVLDVISTNENRLELFTQISFKNTMQFKAGFEYEYFKIESTLENLLDYSFNSYLSLFLSLDADSYNRSSFSTAGSKFEFKAKYVMPLSNDWLSDLFSNSLILQLKYNTNLPVGVKSTLKTGLIAGFTIKNAIPPFQHAFILGGQNENNSFDGFIPFTGFRFVEQQGYNTLVGKIAWQYNVYQTFYITPKVDLGFLSADFEDLFSLKQTMVGFGVTFGYDSFIGPVELSLMGSNYNSKPIGFINIGYSF